MPRTILQVYAAAVCFVSVSCLAIAFGISAYSAVSVLAPSFTVNPLAISPVPRPDVFFPPIPFPSDGSRPIPGTSPSVPVPPTEEELAKSKAAALEAALRNEVALSKQSLVRWGIVALISGLLFLGHWHILRRESSRGA